MTEFTEKILSVIGKEIFQYAETETSSLIFSEEVVKMCRQNLCGNYNKTWTCPPNVGDLEPLKGCCLAYKYAFIFTTVHNIEDSFDIEGMFNGRKEHDAVENKILPLIKETGAMILGAGGCNICEKCAFPEPCRFPDKAKTSMEACGIDVVELSRKLNINYVNGQNTVTYFSAVFFNR